jgi:hypothetical protein
MRNILVRGAFLAVALAFLYFGHAVLGEEGLSQLNRTFATTTMVVCAVGSVAIMHIVCKSGSRSDHSIG